LKGCQIINLTGGSTYLGPALVVQNEIQDENYDIAFLDSFHFFSSRYSNSGGADVKRLSYVYFFCIIGLIRCSERVMKRNVEDLLRYFKNAVVDYV
jgi:hypothetical protein